MMSINKIVKSIACIVGIFSSIGLITGCKGRPTAAESRSSGGSGPAHGPARSACDLITATEASDIVGSPVHVKETSRGESSSKCSYTAAEGQEFLLNVQWRGGKSAWEANEHAVALGGKLLGADRDNAAAGVIRSEEAPLGDKSSYNPILGGYVLQADVLLEFNNLVTLRDARTKWQKLARIALSRLPR